MGDFAGRAASWRSLVAERFMRVRARETGRRAARGGRARCRRRRRAGGRVARCRDGLAGEAAVVAGGAGLVGSKMSMRWWGTRARSSSVGLAVPISMPR